MSPAALVRLAETEPSVADILRRVELALDAAEADYYAGVLAWMPSTAACWEDEG